MLVEVRHVPRLESIRQGHDHHVSALFKRHWLIVTVGVTSGVGVMSTDVMHGIRIRIVPRFLDLVKRLQQECKELRVRIEEDRVRRENDIHRVHVPIGRNLLHEEVGLISVTTQLGCPKSLTSTKGSDGQIVLAGRSEGVSSNSVVKLG